MRLGLGKELGTARVGFVFVWDSMDDESESIEQLKSRSKGDFGVKCGLV